MSNIPIEEVINIIRGEFCTNCNMPVSCAMSPQAECCFLAYASEENIRALYAEINNTNLKGIDNVNR
jgi:hypothetical protein